MVSKVSLNVSGGNKTSTYNLSGSYLNQDGIVNTTGYEAWNIRAKNTFSFSNISIMSCSLYRIFPPIL